jgi:hypothetical protein
MRCPERIKIIKTSMSSTGLNFCFLFSLIQKGKERWVLVAHAYNPSYLGG